MNLKQIIREVPISVKRELTPDEEEISLKELVEAIRNHPRVAYVNVVMDQEMVDFMLKEGIQL